MEKLLAEMHERLPNTHIVVMAILPKVESPSRLSCFQQCPWICTGTGIRRNLIPAHLRV